LPKNFLKRGGKRRYDHRKNDVNEGSDVSSPLSRECIVCSYNTRGYERTANLLVESLHWNFYYCYRCGNWFKTHFKDRRLTFQVRDKKMIRALTWYYNSQVEAFENAPSIGEDLKTAWTKFKELCFKVSEKLPSD
jgi:hypothetical protein